MYTHMYMCICMWIITNARVKIVKIKCTNVRITQERQGGFTTSNIPQSVIIFACCCTDERAELELPIEPKADDQKNFVDVRTTPASTAPDEIEVVFEDAQAEATAATPIKTPKMTSEKTTPARPRVLWKSPISVVKEALSPWLVGTAAANHTPGGQYKARKGKASKGKKQ